MYIIVFGQRQKSFRQQHQDTTADRHGGEEKVIASKM